MQHTENRACARVHVQKDRLRSLQRGDCVCTFLSVCARVCVCLEESNTAPKSLLSWNRSARLTHHSARAYTHTQTRTHSQKPPNGTNSSLYGQITAAETGPALLQHGSGAWPARSCAERLSGLGCVRVTPRTVPTPVFTLLSKAARAG